jgi:hypothetical protein
MNGHSAIHGLMTEFLTAAELLEATRRTRRAGYRDMDAYTPYPVEGLAAELGERRTRVSFVVLVGGLGGAGVGFFMMYYSMAINYRFNSGGRPYNSWPVFIPITFEVMVLVAALAALFGLLYFSGLPQPHHPVFNVSRFTRASQDRFFLCIEATDPKFDRRGTAEFLASLHPHGEIIEVPREPRAEPEPAAVPPHVEAAPPAVAGYPSTDAGASP